MAVMILVPFSYPLTRFLCLFFEFLLIQSEAFKLAMLICILQGLSDGQLHTLWRTGFHTKLRADQHLSLTDGRLDKAQNTPKHGFRFGQEVSECGYRRRKYA